MLRRVRLNDLRGRVSRTIVHDQDLSIPAALLNMDEDFVERRANALTLVVGWNDDAVSSGQRIPSLGYEKPLRALQLYPD